jgi:hypothetical protein
MNLDNLFHLLFIIIQFKLKQKKNKNDRKFFSKSR